MSVAARVSGLGPSPIRELAQGAPPDTIDLGLGVPGWALPQVAREALAAVAAAPGSCGYGPNEGLPELVGAISGRHGVTAEQVMVTAGSQAALFALFQAHVGPGRRVLVPDPGFPAYPTLARLCGAEPTRYRLGEHGWLDAAAFGAALDAHADVALAVVNHPGNPTGGGATPEALRQVAAACRARGVVLLSDEVYRELHLGPRPAGLHDLTDDAVVLSSVSKAWAAPGLRVGWALGPPDLLAPARLVHAAMTTAPARPSQLAAAALLRNSTEVLAQSWRHLVERWSIAQTAPAAVRPQVTPAGGFYLWLALPEGARGDPSAFCLRVRDEGRVTVVPGTAFGPAGAGHVRVSCAGNPGQLAEGLARLAPWWTRP